MKTYFFLLSIIISLASCSLRNTYEYNGDFPAEDYFYDFDGLIKDIKRADSLLFPYRNRIYYTVDTLGDIYLNGHLTSIEAFDEVFNYIIENPDKLSHLPEHIDSATLFIKFLDIDEYLYGKLQEIYTADNYEPDSFLKRLRSKYNDYRKITPLSERIDIHNISVFPTANKYEENLKRCSYQNDNFQELLGLKKIKTINLNDDSIDGRNNLKFRIDEKSWDWFESEENRTWETIENNEVINWLFRRLLNEENNPNYPESPKKAIIYLSCHPDATFNSFYHLFYVEIFQSYEHILDYISEERWQKHYLELTQEQKTELKTEIPLNIKYVDYPPITSTHPLDIQSLR